MRTFRSRFFFSARAPFTARSSGVSPDADAAQAKSAAKDGPPRIPTPAALPTLRNALRPTTFRSCGGWVMAVAPPGPRWPRAPDLAGGLSGEPDALVSITWWPRDPAKGRTLPDAMAERNAAQQHAAPRHAHRAPPPYAGHDR